MKTNQEALEIIKSKESCQLRSYQDTGGVWTIGYGHTRNVEPDQEISQEVAAALLEQDIELAEGYVNRLCKMPLSENQFSALVSLVFNIGYAHFRRSTLLSLLNDGDYLAAANQFLRWVFDNGRELKGLVERRVLERRLFLKAPSPTP